jgi:hypothetical protein
LEAKVQSIQTSPCVQDLRSITFHIFRLNRFHGMLLSPRAFASRSASVLKVACSQPFCPAGRIQQAPKWRTHFPWSHPHWPLASILLYGVRTFLGPREARTCLSYSNQPAYRVPYPRKYTRLSPGLTQREAEATAAGLIRHKRSLRSKPSLPRNTPGQRERCPQHMLVQADPDDNRCLILARRYGT